MALADDIGAQLRAVMQVPEQSLRLLLVGLFAQGHVLLEDVPGVGKTTLARALARSLDLDFARVQFTPDLMPSDILGATLLRPAQGSFEFRRGPVFTQLLLADEINRASPRTQAALLQAMSEAQVSIDGSTYPLPSPFCVLATQNPIDFEGTFPLPEAQLDRFLLRVHLGYPDEAQELQLVQSRREADPLEAVRAVGDAQALLAAQSAVRQVRVTEAVTLYGVRLVRETRRLAELSLGASPRAALALHRAAQALALVRGRDFVSPDDLQSLARPVLAHRVRLASGASYSGRSAAQLIDQLIARVPVPT